MKRDSLKLYFIALVPTEPLFAEVNSIKTEFSERYNSKAALRSPPHITLHMPFQWKEEREILLKKTLDETAASNNKFDFQLDGFGAFPPRVIFIKVIDNNPLFELYNEVQVMARSKWNVIPKKHNRPFRPHMTVAFRDLKKVYFKEAWAEFKSRKFNAEVTVSDLCLLKHNGKNWEELYHSTFK